MGLFRTSAATFIIKCAELGAATLAAMMLNHFMEVEERGQLAMLMLMPITFFTISSMSIHVVTVREIGAKEQPLGTYAGTVFVLSLLTIGLYFLLYLGAGALGLVRELTLENRNLIRLALAIGPFMLLTHHLGGLLQGTMNIRWFNIVMTAHRFVNLVLIGALVVGGRVEIPLVLGVNVVGVAFAAVVALLYVRRVAPVRSWRVSRAATKKLIMHGLTVHIGTIAVFFYARNGVMMVKGYHGDRAVAYLTIALMIAESFLALFQAVFTVLLPSVSGRTYEEACELTAKATRAFVLVALTAAIVISLASPVVIFLYAGRKYFPSILPLVVLMFGQVFLMSHSMTSVLPFHRKWYVYSTAVVTGGLALSLLLNYLLVPRYGHYGAAIGMSTAYALQFLYVCATMKPLFGCRARDVFVPRKADVTLLVRHLREFPREVRSAIDK